MTSKTFTILLQTLFTMGFFAFVIWSIWYKPDSSGEYWQKPGFKTDTIHLDIAYKDIPKIVYTHQVPPTVVLNYYDSTKTVQNVYVHNTDSLIQVIDSLKKEITKINPNYLKLYPIAHKLLYAEFTRDSLRLDLLNINGHIFTEFYSLNYSKFKYQYLENRLRAENLKKHSWQSSTYLYGGYDLIQTSPLIGADYSFHRNRYRLTAFTNIYLNKTPQVYLGTTIGYKLK